MNSIDHQHQHLSRPHPAAKRWRTRLLGAAAVCIATTVISADPATAGEPRATGAPVARLVGAWELDGPVVVVWPARISGRRNLTPLYTTLLSPLPPTIDVALVATRPPSARDMDALGRPARYLPTPTVQDVLIQDWSGWAGIDKEGRLLRVLPDQAADRFTGRERRRAQDDHAAGQAVADNLYGRRHDLPLVMTGTQLAHNGGELALVSNRVIHQNEHLSLDAIKQTLRQNTGLEQIIFLPVPPNKEDGGLTGLVRFVGPTQLLVAAPAADQDQTSEAYFATLAQLLADQLPDDIELIKVPRATGKAADAYGNYLHGLQVGYQLWLPDFGQPTDEVVQRYLQAALPDLTIRALSGDALREAIRDGIMPDRIHAIY